MDSMFLNLTRGSRLSAFLGLEMVPGFESKFGPNYQYVEIPFLHFLKDDGSTTDEAKPNQHLEVVAACNIHVRGSYPVLVQYNPALQVVGSLGSSHICWPGEDGKLSPSYYVTFRKGLKASDISWAVRLSLLA